MRYVSNLIAPDLRPYFKLLDPPKQILGHDAPSDPDFEPDCTFWTDDEAAILYTVAKQVGGTWIDVGARFGWTAAHLMEAGCKVEMYDPEYYLGERKKRAKSNIENWRRNVLEMWDGTPKSRVDRVISGVLIDGCHDEPEPFNDAITAHGDLWGEGVILLHDFWGEPIRRAVNWLIDTGYKCRIYSTPNGVALCWRMAGFIPPEHQPDPRINWAQIREERCPEFDFRRCM